jgi:hypothetical protein
MALFLQKIYINKGQRKKRRQEVNTDHEEIGMLYALSTGVGNGAYRDALVDELCRRANEHGDRQSQTVVAPQNE